MEGALETAQLALGAYRRRPCNVPRLHSQKVVYVEGRAINVADWMDVHPGGRAALENHMEEDVTQLMKHMNHSDHAWAVVHSLKQT